MPDYTMNLHDPLSAALADLEKAGERGARRGVNRGASIVSRAAKANISGRPRWDHRGAGRTGPDISLDLTPHHQPKNGGPGVLTGNLKARVHKFPARRRLDGYEAKVSAMGGPQNLYAPLVESNYPFLEPAAQDFQEIAHDVYETAWAEAIGAVK